MFQKLKFIKLIFLLPTFKWIALSVIIGVLVGTAGAVFLSTLHWVTEIRDTNLWLISFLPLGGLIIGYLYYKHGREVENGNKIILLEHAEPTKTIPFRMAPLIYVTTLITHIFGGSAGREGTAVQIGAAIADQFSGIFKVERRGLLIIGIATGFAAVFGTPWAGAVFALEITRKGGWDNRYIFPAIFSAWIAHLVSHNWGIAHALYEINLVPPISIRSILYSILAGLIFGLVSGLFIYFKKLVSDFFIRKIPYPPLRPIIGGTIIALFIFFADGFRFSGLGIEYIQKAFFESAPAGDFMIKLLLTAFTLGVGFKGGEVTPLFFIGATLGSFLTVFIPLPMAMLAGMGFISVFGSASRAPVACLLMGLEIFGLEPFIFFALCIFSAYLAIGKKGIYTD